MYTRPAISAGRNIEDSESVSTPSDLRTRAKEEEKEVRERAMAADNEGWNRMKVLSAVAEIEGVRGTASLSGDGVIRWTAGEGGRGEEKGVKKNNMGGRSSLNARDDCLGFSMGSSTIMLHSFLLEDGGCFGGGLKRSRKDIKIDFDSIECHSQWVNALTEIISKGRPKRLVVFLNPRSGAGNAKQVYRNTVQPLFNAADIDVDLIETEHFQHAEEVARGLNLDCVDGIICASGDGIMYEVLNGLLNRADWQEAIKTPFGVIPCGSGNGMAKSLLSLTGEPCDPGSATFSIILGRTQSLDVATVKQGQTERHFCLNMCWGLPSDVDIESEQYQWLGGLRLTLQSIIRIINLRMYNGVIKYLPYGRRDLGGNGSEQPDQRAGLLGPEGAENEETDRTLQGDWQEIRGQFVLMWLQNTKYAATDMMPAPDAQLSDGCLDIFLIRKCGRLKLLYLLLCIESGAHVNFKEVTYLKIRALKLEAGGRSTGKDSGMGGYVAADGEILARGAGTRNDGRKDPLEYNRSMDVSIRQGLATVFCAGE